MRKIFIILSALFAALATQAQELGTVWLKLEQEPGVLANAQGVRLFTFSTRPQAEAALKLLAAGDVEKLRKLAGFIAEGVTEIDGGCYIKLDKAGCMVIDPENLDLDIEVVSSNPTEPNGDICYTLRNRTTMLKEHSVQANRRLQKEPDMASPQSCGGVLYFAPVAVAVDSMYAHEDARLVVVPEIWKDGRLWKKCPPTVMDGEPYHKSQIRRMDYDIANDRLAPYITDRSMHTHRNDTLLTRPFCLDNLDPQAEYKGYIRFSYENFHTVYHEGGYLWWDGSARDPMRFLDWKSVLKSLPIDHTRYRWPVRVDKERNTMSGLKVDYAVGSKEINLEDSITRESIGQIERQIRAYYGNDSFIDRMVIKGYASPEGNLAGNQRLSKERAHTLARWLNRRYTDKSRLKHVEAQGFVTTWSDVARYLEESIGNEQARAVAARLRDIIAANKSADAQWAHIKAAQWYPYVEREVLPNMRRVDVEFTYVTDRVKTPEEIHAAYLRDGEDYIRQAKPYEIYELLKDYGDSTDWAVLERIAQVAFASVTEPAQRTDRNVQGRDAEGNITFYTSISPIYQRPYALAAYQLVRSRLMQHKADTLTLAQYIDWSNKGKENHKQFDGQSAGWWNDEAIVTLQALMYCEAGAYAKAYALCKQHLNDDPKHTALKMFVRALNCEHDIPEVADYIAQSSPLNGAVMALANKRYKVALRLLANHPDIDRQDPQVQYLTAICRFHTEARDTAPSAGTYSAGNIHKNEDADELGEKDFAAPMLSALLAAPEMAEKLLCDGYFNTSYHQLVLFFLKGVQEGMDMEAITREWNAIRKK